MGAFLVLTTSMFWFWVTAILIAILTLSSSYLEDKIFFGYYRQGYKHGVERMYEKMKGGKK